MKSTLPEEKSPCYEGKSTPRGSLGGETTDVKSILRARGRSIPDGKTTRERETRTPRGVSTLPGTTSGEKSTHRAYQTLRVDWLGSI